MIQDSLLHGLHEDCQMAPQPDGSILHPRRKDMQDFPAIVDRFATLALATNLKGHIYKMPFEELVDLEVHKEQHLMILWESILAGSIRGRARLQHSHKLSPICQIC